MTEALQDYKGNIYAYRYQGVTIRVDTEHRCEKHQSSVFTFWKSALGYDLFDRSNTKLYFDTLADAKARIDRKQVSA